MTLEEIVAARLEAEKEVRSAIVRLLEKADLRPSQVSVSWGQMMIAAEGEIARPAGFDARITILI